MHSGISSDDYSIHYGRRKVTGLALSYTLLLYVKIALHKLSLAVAVSVVIISDNYVHHSIAE